jgi:hypothetical protein
MDGTVRRLNIHADVPLTGLHGHRHAPAMCERDGVASHRSGRTLHVAAKGGQWTVNHACHIGGLFPIVHAAIPQDSPKKRNPSSNARKPCLAMADVAQSLAFVVAQPRASEHLYPSVDHGFVRCCAVTQKQSASGPNI